MLTWKTPLAAALVLVAGAATAETMNAGAAQLALSAGVEPGAYSNSQLIRLLEAEEDNDTGVVDFIKGQRHDMTSRGAGYISAPLSGSPFGAGDHNDRNN